ncbi:MAG: Na/Pi cotransporter family protein, partial [Paludibacteraceae bacterium]|nr:Na/Pi cotransporter family protein [Paludibacteraceae bacterium]
MTAVDIISAVLTLLAGVGIFLVACQMMSSNLESASSKRLKVMFKKASKSKLLGVGIGALGTAAIQSSGATTVMTIGFVNAGIISLAQAATIIYGANIGTTITAQIVALGMLGSDFISTTIIFSAFAGLGAFMALFAKKDNLKTIGGILTGFGMLFVGLELMSDSMNVFAESEGVKMFLSGIENPLLLVIIGAIFTAIIQSSSVMTSIALALVFTGLISLDQGIYITMGSNIGSCVVALMAGSTGSVNARRTAYIHLLFNCAGVLMFLIVGALMHVIGGIGFGALFEKLFPGGHQMQLAMFHTVFNCATVCIMLPLTNVLVSTVCRIAPDKAVKADDNEPRTYYIDDNLLSTPPIAVEQTKKEILNMAKIANDNFNRSINVISSLDFSDVNKFRSQEKELNFLNRTLVDYVVRLSERSGLNEHDHVFLSSTFRVVRDIERIGDYAENIIEYATSLSGTGEKFSDDALKEITYLSGLINALYEKVDKAYHKED